MLGLILAASLACTIADEAPVAAVELDCTEPCAELRQRQLVVAKRCALPEAIADRDCGARSLVRLDCQVSCMESAECDLLDGTNTAYTSSLFGPYIRCLEECPGSERD